MFGALVERLHDLSVDVWHWMGYTRRPPQQNGFRDLLMKLDPAVLEGALTAWMSDVLGHDVTTEDLAGVRVDEKTNEHKAALELLKTIVLKGRVIVGDAMFCQRDVCRQIVDSGGHYLICVKENQPTSLREIELEPAADGAAPPLASHWPPYAQREREEQRQTAGSNAAR